MKKSRIIGIELRVRVPINKDIYEATLQKAGYHIDNVLMRTSHETLIIKLDAELDNGYLIDMPTMQTKRISKVLSGGVFDAVICTELLVVVKGEFERPDFSISKSIINLCSCLNANLSVYKYASSLA